jgi:L-lactate dehydrogenase complex protein LldG
MSLASSSASRAAILERIRSQQGRSGSTSEAEFNQAREHIAKHEVGPQPSFARIAPNELVTHFQAQCDRLQTTHELVNSASEAPVAIARYVSSLDGEQTLVAWPDLQPLDWAMQSLTLRFGNAKDGDTIGITSCFCAVAETGTLLLLSSAAMPKTVALLPDTHICLLPKSRIVATMEEAFALVRKEVGQPPRSMFFVSGPSRTADIEQTLVIGAHGPYRVHVVLV